MKTEWLVIGLALAGLSVGCGDDDSGSSVDAGPVGETDGGEGSDAGPVMAGDCPSGEAIPDVEGLMGPCCARVSNADRMDMPELRVSALTLTQPGSLGNPIVRGVLNGAIDEERFNWLMRATVSGGEVTVETGYGQRQSDATFSFVEGGAPSPGDPDRWNPVSLDGTLTGETIEVPPLPAAFSVPIFEEDATTLIIELPLNQFQVEMATLSEDRTCIGLRSATGRSYDTSQGVISTYVTVADAMEGRVEVSPFDTSLCRFIAGLGNGETPCTEEPLDSWMFPPDATCDDDGACNTDCSGETCNAWLVRGNFSAHGVEIN